VLLFNAPQEKWTIRGNKAIISMALDLFFGAAIGYYLASKCEKSKSEMPDESQTFNNEINSVEYFL
jgi:hypothetical protein